MKKYFGKFSALMSVGLLSFSGCVFAAASDPELQMLTTISQQLSQLINQQENGQKQDQAYQQSMVQLMFPVVPYPNWQQNYFNANAIFSPIKSSFFDSSVIPQLQDLFSQKSGVSSKSIATELLQNISTSFQDGQLQSQNNQILNALSQYNSLDVASMNGVQVERVALKVSLLNAQLAYMNYAAQKDTQSILKNLLAAELLLIEKAGEK